VSESLQDRYAPRNICFGCGPINPRGLRIKSFVEGEEVVAEFHPEPHQEAYAGSVNGGILGTLIDCHSNWTATWHLMKQAGTETPPCTVTAELHVKFLRPTPSNAPIKIRAHVIESDGRRAKTEATVESGGQVTAVGQGVFVAVKEGHPAYHRW
jgi:acyl-coenzyme A thioesterase PaaI-like protein